jgi:hypothetical protein
MRQQLQKRMKLWHVAGVLQVTAVCSSCAAAAYFAAFFWHTASFWRFAYVFLLWQNYAYL